MILVVADTGPLCYLILIEAIGLLPRLYDRIVIPSAVLRELIHPKAPTAVKTWADTLPSWAEVRTADHAELDDILDPGEAEAIILAEQLKADSLLLDEMEARREALRRGLPVAGTIGVLEKAAERNLINLSEAFSKLARTSFLHHPGSPPTGSATQRFKPQEMTRMTWLGGGLQNRRHSGLTLPLKAVPLN